MRIVIAPDSFKGTLSAHDVTVAIAQEWTRARPGDALVRMPLADGGEGTLDVIAARSPGSVLRQLGDCTGPDGQAVPGRYLTLADGTSVVELAVTSGIGLMPALDPMRASSRGLGEVIVHAVRAGASRVVVAVGGSASTDGGTGALSAMGARFLGRDGRPIADGGGALVDVARVDLSRLLPAVPAELLVDVRVPLLGPSGASAVFAPQKGADAASVRVLESGLRRLSSLLGGDPTAPGAGAAGGVGYGLSAAWGAELSSGAATVADLCGLPAELAVADLLITGEGSFDRSSGQGKVVGELLKRAGRLRVRTVVVCGSASAGHPPGAWLVASLAEAAGSVRSAHQDPRRWLRQVVGTIADDHELFARIGTGG